MSASLLFILLCIYLFSLSLSLFSFRKATVERNHPETRLGAQRGRGSLDEAPAESDPGPDDDARRRGSDR